MKIDNIYQTNSISVFIMQEKIRNLSENYTLKIKKTINKGGLEIGTQGCTYGNILMYKGSETGKIVYFDWDISSESPPYLTGMTFLDWYLSFFEEIAAGHYVTSFGYKLLCTEETLIELFYRAEKLEEKQKILSSFYRFQKLSDQSIIMKQTKSKDKRLLETCEWMKTKYQEDQHIYTLLSVEDIKEDIN